jgi:hypothetical protein
MSILDKYNLTEEQRDRVMTKVASTISELQKTDTLEKVAVDWHSPIAQTGLALAATAVGTGISMGVPKLVDAIRAASIRRNKDEYLKAMKDAHPELKNVSQRDLDLAYNSMAMHSPGVIKDPLLGGQVMKEITGRAMRWDLNQYSTLNRTAGGGLADYEHQALQQFGKGVGNLTNVYYDASAKADQAKRDQERLNLSQQVHTYNTQKDQRAEQFQKDQFDYRKTQDSAADAFNKEKFQFEKDKNTEAKAYQDKQLANQDRQFTAQEARDRQQQGNFERTFNANEADRTFSREMSNKNYLASQNRDTQQQTNFDRQFTAQEARDKQQQGNFERTFNANAADRTFQQNMANQKYNLDSTNQAYNMGFDIERGGHTTNRYDVAHKEALGRAQADLNFKMKNQKDVNTLARSQSYNQAQGQAQGQVDAENRNYAYHMNKAYDMGYHGTTGKNDAPAILYDTKSGNYIGNKPDNYRRPYK